MELVPKSAPLETSTEPLLPTSPAEEGTTGCLQSEATHTNEGMIVLIYIADNLWSFFTVTALYVEFPEDEKPPADHEVCIQVGTDVPELVFRTANVPLSF